MHSVIWCVRSVCLEQWRRHAEMARIDWNEWKVDINSVLQTGAGWCNGNYLIFFIASAACTCGISSNWIRRAERVKNPNDCECCRLIEFLAGKTLTLSATIERTKMCCPSDRTEFSATASRWLNVKQKIKHDKIRSLNILACISATKYNTLFVYVYNN